MALAVRDHIKPHKMLNGTPFPIWAVAKASGTTWLEGAVIIGTSGLAVEAADGPTMGTILGIAQSPAIDGETIGLIIPALPGVVFSGVIGTGDTGGDYTSLITNRFLQYGLSLEGTSGTWYINAADVTDEAALVMDFIDEIGDNHARVQFTIIDSVFSAMALHQ
jgi:hypothetical protein